MTLGPIEHGPDDGTLTAANVGWSIRVSTRTRSIPARTSVDCGEHQQRTRLRMQGVVFACSHKVTVETYRGGTA